MTDKWAEYREKFCGCKDASRLNSCRGRNNCELPVGHPERVKAEAAAPPSKHKEIDMTDTISVPRELRQILGLILNALDRDAAEGKASRGEMAQELRALLQAPAQPAQVQGWQMVPVDADEAILDVLYNNGLDEADDFLRAIWSRLLAAAPKPPVQQCEAPSCGCADAYCKAWDEAPQPSDDVAKDVLLSVLTDIANTDLTGADDSVIRFIFVALQHRAKAAIDAAMAGGGK